MPSSYASFEQRLPPTAPSHSVACALTSPAASSTSYPSSRGLLLSHLVTARGDTLQIWQVRKQADTHDADPAPQLYHVQTKSFFGVITGLQATRTIESDTDGKDRLVVSFKDAKIALLEWDEVGQTLATVSIHTYERASQLTHGTPLNYKTVLATDPSHRCTALLLPRDALAVLPFTSSSDLDLLDDVDDFDEIYGNSSSAQSGRDGQARNMMPYTPSFILPLSEVDAGIRNVRDVAFLPNFQKPTIAVLCESESQTWTSSLMMQRDTLHLYIFTLDLSTTSHPVLSHVQNLPYDCLYLKACESLGGLFVVTPTNLIHVDQNGKLVGLRVSAWSERVTTNDAVLAFPEWSLAGDRDQIIDLCNSQLVWTEKLGVPVKRNEQRAEAAKPSTGSGLLFLNDGRVFALRCTLDGRSISSIHLDAVEPAGETGRLAMPASCAVAVPQHPNIPYAGCQLFVGSMLGSSRLLTLGATAVQEALPEANGNGSANAQMDVDLDDDADLYGESSATANSHAAKFSTKLVYTYDIVDTMPSVGPLSDLALAVIQDREHNDVVKMVAAHGGAPEGGFVHFETEIQPRNQRVLWSDGQSSRIWGVGSNAYLAQQQSADEAFVFAVDKDDQPEQLAVLPVSIIEAKQLASNSFVIASRDKLSVYKLDRLHSGPVHEMRFHESDAHVVSISAPDAVSQASSLHVVALFSDGSIRLFDVSVDGQLSAIEHKFGTYYAAAHLFVDASGATDALSDAPNPADQSRRAPIPARNDDEDEVDYGDDMDDDAAAPQQQAAATPSSASDRRLRLALFTNDGSVEIYNASQELLWRSNTVLDLPERLEGLASSEPVVVCSDVSSKNARLLWLGALADGLAIASIQSDGLFTIWTSTRSGTTLTFNKAFTKVLAPQGDQTTLVPPNGEPRKSADPTLVPFDLRSTLQDSTASALFLTGSDAGWLIKTRRGALNFYPSSVGTVEDVITCSADSPAYLYATPHGLTKATFPKLDFDLPIARTHHSSGRDYTHVRPYPATRCLVAASTVNTPFVLFDTEEGEVIRDLNVDPTFALSKRGSLELFKHDWDEPIDGFEFDQNETVTALELLTLTSAGSLTGLREFVAVGTTIYNGEDRPTRGAMYIFEVIETVPDQAEPELNCRLKLLVKDDAGKGPVTALADISGYVVVAVGQKLFIRAFENHESLIHVAFLDTYYLTTSIRRLGSTLLLSDVHKSITFVGFQEDPFKLTVFAHDYVESYSTTANYLVTEDSLSFVSTDWHGSLRLLEYNPNTFNNSHYGSRLNVKTEFQTGVEWTCSTTVAGSSDTDGHAGLAVSNEILLGGIDGSLASVRPVAGSATRGLTTEATFNALNALQNQLVRAVPHAAALNPRGHRIVKNDWQSRPLNKGVLDVAALRSWLQVGRPKMVEVVESLQLSGAEAAGKGRDGDNDDFKVVLKALRAVL